VGLGSQGERRRCGWGFVVGEEMVYVGWTSSGWFVLSG
jgi:hypothetical protein